MKEPNYYPAREEVRDALYEVECLMAEGPSRELSLVRTKLEEALMWLTAAEAPK